MKRIFIALSLFASVSCSGHYSENIEGIESYHRDVLHYDAVSNVSVYTIRGHEYLFVKYSYGAGLVHLESCSCKSK